MQMDLSSLITAFTFVFLSEIGDKTQIAVIMLSSRSSPRSVIVGSMLAFFVVDGVSALIGKEALSHLPHGLIDLTCGFLFLTIGMLSILREEAPLSLKDLKASTFKAFSMVALMELGDKTQFASVALAAGSSSPWLVLAGIMLAFSLITCSGVALGSRLLRLLPRRQLGLLTSALCLAFGLFFIYRASNYWAP